jgi:S-adenosylmethionine synthetase
MRTEGKRMNNTQHRKMTNTRTTPDNDVTRVHLFTSESVSEGHPDKVADTIADAVLDAYLAQDPGARVACEVLCKKDHVVLAGEVDAQMRVDHAAIAREAIRRIGYTAPTTHFHADGVTVLDLIGRQSSDISRGILAQGDLGAGDQGLVFGYATDESPELMPLPLVLAHRLTAALTQARRDGSAPWLRPDAKAQVSVRYEGITPTAVDTVVVSTQHSGGKPVVELQEWLRDQFIPQVLGSWWNNAITLHANPAGDFVEGGPEADCGVTGRKIIVDTYGGMARHGGGAFSGKDATKVDRSAAYFARFVARQIVQRGIAQRAELQVCYAIGVAQPVALRVETFGTGDQAAAEHLAGSFDYRPAAIIEQLGLRAPIFSASTNYGHFGKAGMPWEA